MQPLGFTKILLLAACTLFPSSFANDLQALHSTVKNHALRRDTVIRGLLDTRQFVCPAGDSICETEFCCQPGWECCKDGSCCQPGTTCVVGSNGVIGCCPVGELCSGPIGPPETVNPFPPTNPPPSPNPPPPTETFSTSTDMNGFTTLSTSTPTTTSTATFRTPSTSPGPGGLSGFSTQNPAPTTGPTSSATNLRAQPYRLLLVFGGILLAVIYYA